MLPPNTMSPADVSAIALTPSTPLPPTNAEKIDAPVAISMRVTKPSVSSVALLGNPVLESPGVAGKSSDLVAPHTTTAPASSSFTSTTRSHAAPPM